MFVDDDSDSGDAFEIGIANANKKSVNQYSYLQEDESLDSLPKNSNRALEVSGSEFPPDFTVNDFMNSQANRRRIQTANKNGTEYLYLTVFFLENFGGFENKRPMIGNQSSNQAVIQHHSDSKHHGMTMHVHPSMQHHGK